MGSEYIRIFQKAKEKKPSKKYFRYFCKTCNKPVSSTLFDMKNIECRFCGHRARRI